MLAKDTDVRNEITKENSKKVRIEDLQSFLVSFYCSEEKESEQRVRRF